ncbi:MAG TPA: DivIVA domain-containing protein [Tissierellia bacterium]|nr:DivIVA domain-containing protein [Tissierellia bacterium]
MITPLDIQNKEFKRSIRGYKESEVDEFLDEIIKDYEKIYKENIELKDKILLLNEQIEKYNSMEDTLKETLIVAQSTADELILAAKQKAELIIKEATNESKKLIEEAQNEVKSIRKEYEYLLKEMIIFRTRYKSLIESQLTTLEQFYSDIESKELSINRSKNLEEEYIGEVEDKELEEYNEIEENIRDLGA